MKYVSTFTFVLLVFTSCSQSSDLFVDLKNSNDSLIQKIQAPQIYIQALEKRIPAVSVKNVLSKSCTIKLLIAFGVNLELELKRPKKDNQNFLCVPAAYSTTGNFIDGLFISNGMVVNQDVNPLLTGACIVYSNSIRIIRHDEINEALKTEIVKAEQSFFQQTLLVKDSQLVNCNLFGERKNVRRALIQFNDYYCIGESDRPITIKEFQESLIEIGASDAINLDMGTWSEGWYKDSDNRTVTIGETMTNTPRQTNWIVFVKK